MCGSAAGRGSAPGPGLEGVILVRRSGPERPVAAFAEAAADAALRIVGAERA